ncbi:helix-turn-helix domain-containing protein [Neobacillus niacini]|uniref:helix-turn-helix domain-containing protein n=1 Tax=Neobacillus niacini TaxID=86668 RepID=UPI00203AD3D7|nr:helix-turn-helix domain-containing protein [Neobacillus niacini]MCM3690633.1 helix-turn-helix domain-containing protein [Neobacillus niacini]
MEGKWLIADRDLNEREGLKWLLKSSSIPVSTILLASNYQDFIVSFEKDSPDIILLELDMVTSDNWSSFRELVQIYQPILLITSAEATFEKARLAIDLQAIELMIKPFSATKVKSAYQKATKALDKKKDTKASPHLPFNKDLSYEALFISERPVSEDYIITAFKIENTKNLDVLYSFLTDYPFREIHGIFPLNDMVVLLFKETCQSSKEQCQKAMRKWDEEFSDTLAIVVRTNKSPQENLKEKFHETVKMLEFTYYRGYRQIVEFSYTPKWIHIDPFLAPPEQRGWVDMLTNHDIEGIKRWLYNEFLQMEDPYPDPGLVRIRLTSILAQIRRFMKTYELDEQQNYENEYRHIFHSILYDSVLYRSVQNLILFVQKLFLAAGTNPQMFKQDLIERGIAFIESNFTNKDLKLEDVAKYVDRNSSYFSHLLISKTGRGFTDILSGIRLKEAKRYLLETNKPVKEVAMLVGFHNPNYFSRIFKEVVGVSPREYRMNKK